MEAVLLTPGIPRTRSRTSAGCTTAIAARAELRSLFATYSTVVALRPPHRRSSDPLTLNAFRNAPHACSCVDTRRAVPRSRCGWVVGRDRRRRVRPDARNMRIEMRIRRPLVELSAGSPVAATCARVYAYAPTGP